MNTNQPSKGLVIVLCLFLIASIAGVYGRTAGFDFVDFDDSTYVSNNPKVPAGLTWDGVKWAFTTMHSGNWIPLVWLSLMLDKSLLGAGAAGFHLVNVALHIANTVLLFWVLKRYSKAIWPSFFVAALFGLHPLHVESVAWVTERKDVLCTLFWMLTMLVYVQYVERRTAGRYITVCVIFALGLMAKSMLVTLPLVLLLTDYWPLKRLWPEERKNGFTVGHLLLEKFLLIVMSILVCVITVVAQKNGGSVAKINIVPLGQRIGNALISYCQYLIKMFWPVDLAVFYPHPSAGIAAWKIMASASALLSITVVVLLLRRRRYLLAGWLWYLVTLVPVIGLVQVGRQAMADRYTYIPLTGIFIMLAWFASEIVAQRRSRQAIAGVIGAAIIGVLGVMTFVQVGYWRDSITLFTRAAAVTTDNYLAYSVLGTRFAQKGDFDKARSELEKAMKFNVNEIDVLYNIAKGLAALGRTDEAIGYYNRILATTPGDTDTYIALATMETDKGNFVRAIDIYRKGLGFNPENGDLHGRLGSLFLQMGKADEAIAELETAVKLKADSAIYGNLGTALLSKGQAQSAIEYYKKAIWIDPANAEAHYNLGNVYLAMELPADAAGEYAKAIKAKPDYSKAYGNLGAALSMLGKQDEGVVSFHYAVELDPNNIEARFNFAAALADKGMIDESIEQLHKIIELLPDNTAVRNNLAALLLQKGQIEQAIAEYEQVLKIDPADTIAQEGLNKAKEVLVAVPGK